MYYEYFALVVVLQLARLNTRGGFWAVGYGATVPN
jgi:hypothetical protein